MRRRCPKILLWADRQLERLARLFAVIGGAAVFVLMGVTVAAVIWRYFLNRPIFGIEDLSVLALIIVAGASVAFGDRRDAHISVDVISYFLGEKARRFTNLAMRLAVFLITGLASYALAVKACGIEKACVTGNLSIEQRPFYYYLSAAFAFLTAQAAVRLLIEMFGAAGGAANRAGD